MDVLGSIVRQGLIGGNTMLIFEPHINNLFPRILGAPE